MPSPLLTATTSRATRARRSGVRAAWLALATTLALVSATGARGDEAPAPPAGIIKTVTGQVRIERAGQSLPATVGLALQRQDRIVTGTPGGIGITLVDDTLLTAGPGTQLELSEVRFDATTHDGRLWIRLVRGALHMVTGLIAREAPQNVRIETPTAVMGVRGTDFVVETDGDR